MRIVLALACFVAVFAAAAAPAGAPLLPWHLVKEYPHDPASFTEGLVLDANGRLIESSGSYGKSELTIRDLASGKALKSATLPARYFGEGATLMGGQIVQLTWREGTGFVYDLDLKQVRQFSFTGEGWGLTNDGKQLIQSDGSADLYFVDPQTFSDVGHIAVHDGDTEIYNLNELEYARGRIYANVWHSDRIAVIVPETGQVEAWIDLTALKSRFAQPAGWDPQDNVLNGIAYAPRSGHFYVTGKRWPRLFEIALDPPAASH
jgi:glutamine cyclotransferase